MLAQVVNAKLMVVAGAAMSQIAIICAKVHMVNVKPTVVVGAAMSWAAGSRAWVQYSKVELMEAVGVAISLTFTNARSKGSFRMATLSCLHVNML